MATTTVHTCDICKQSKSLDDLARLEIKTSGITIKDYSKYSPLKIDICSDCLKRKGFLVDEAANGDELEQQKLKNKVTLEDKIYDFLQDLGVAFAE